MNAPNNAETLKLELVIEQLKTSLGESVYREAVNGAQITQLILLNNHKDSVIAEKDLEVENLKNKVALLESKLRACEDEVEIEE